jgi:hypothetical protein
MYFPLQIWTTVGVVLLWPWVSCTLGQREELPDLTQFAGEGTREFELVEECSV